MKVKTTLPELEQRFDVLSGQVGQWRDRFLRAGGADQFAATRPGETTAMRYYALSWASVLLGTLPLAQQIRLPRYPAVPVTLRELSPSITHCAGTSSAARFSARFGLVTFADSPHRLLLPVPMVRAVRE